MAFCVDTLEFCASSPWLHSPCSSIFGDLVLDSPSLGVCAHWRSAAQDFAVRILYSIYALLLTVAFHFLPPDIDCPVNIPEDVSSRGPIATDARWQNRRLWQILLRRQQKLPLKGATLLFVNLMAMKWYLILISVFTYFITNEFE